MSNTREVSASQGKVARKERARPRWGVIPAAVAYCQCGWHSGWHASAGMFGNAHVELAAHRKSCPQGI